MNIVQIGANAADPRLGPDAVVVDLSGNEGLALREQALKEAIAVLSKGGEAGNQDQQATGKLAEIVLRRLLPDAMEGTDLGHDFILASGLKVDSKCRGGEMPFAREYRGEGQRRGRESKHNFFAGQVFGGDPTRGGRQASADVYVLSHLHMAAARKDSKTKKSLPKFPGTAKQKNWALYLCGWAGATSGSHGFRRKVMTQPGLVSWSRVRELIGFDRDDLERIAAQAPRHYEGRDRHVLGKKKWRHIDDPRPVLKDIQSRLVEKLLRPITLPAYFCGSLSDRSAKTAVQPHVGKPEVVALDLCDFFRRTSWLHVHAV